MGGSGSRLSKELLAEYQDLTFLTKQEILLAHRRFCELLPQEQRSVEQSLLAQVPFEQILSLPELKANPFKERICRVFSTSPTRDSLSFEDFLDLLSVFSDTATPDIKSHYAFRIFGENQEQPGRTPPLPTWALWWPCLGNGVLVEPQSPSQPCLLASCVCSLDFDDDGTLNREDLSRLVNCLTGEGEDTRLSASEMKQLIDNILEESDIDRDGTINLSEFQHVISRSPDFARYDSGAPAFWVPAGPDLLPLGLGHCYRRWCQGERKPQSIHTGPAKLAVSPRAGAALLVKASPLATAIVIALCLY
uniref:calcium and integrin-binding protein 1 isoform X1 n=1 Tax=Macaca mulatta TaxID=9544 RepID=UPI0005F4946F|nr:calcium and integrin-binding protein 1 isoform X1 [Macaca nemestrina]XP_014998501.1 calcium and integrin-binding protein 1 isoform X1 [Macaca mulatta]